MPTFTNLRSTTPHFPPSAVESMLSLVSSAPLPPRPPFPTSNDPAPSSSPSAPRPPKEWELGVEYDYLIKLRDKWLHEWSWDSLSERLSKMDHFLVDYADPIDENETGDKNERYELTLHFVHQRSTREDAIPLLILHGWPGTFFDFHKVIDPLVNPPLPSLPAFHVIAPSLPGYFLSTLPRQTGFSLPRFAKLFNALMVDCLGYDKYVGQGGDWGAMTLRIISSLYPSTCIAPHFNMFRAFVSDKTRTELTPPERAIMHRRDEFAQSGFGYFGLQGTKPYTLALSLCTSPLPLLTYLLEKFYSWSDPSTLDPMDVLDTVTLYWLSGCFVGSVVVYHQSKKHREEMNLPAEDGFWAVKTKTFGFSSFPYEIGSSPRKSLEAYGNLTFYKAHTYGGHFPALDNPDEFVDDLREYFGSTVLGLVLTSE